jgi:hypothetical protein
MKTQRRSKLLRKRIFLFDKGTAEVHCRIGGGGKGC